MAAPTLQELQRATLRILNEAADSPIGELEPGDGGAATIATAASLTEWINTAAAEIARVYKINGSGTKASVSAQVTELSALTTTGGSILWDVHTVTWGGTRIEYVDIGELDMWKPAYRTETGTPTHWFKAGEGSIGLWKTPSSSGTIVAYGHVLPTLLSASGDTLTFLPEDLARKLIPRRAAMVAAEKNAEPAMIERLKIWIPEHEADMKMLVGGTRAGLVGG